MSNMKLLGKRVIFRRIEEQKKVTILMATPQEERYYKGEVIIAGSETGINKGTTLLVDKRNCDLIDWDGEELYLVEAEVIIAING